MSQFVPSAFGWSPDLPDFRDWTLATPAVAQLLRQLKPRSRQRSARTHPQRVDLREYFPPAYDQRGLCASSAHACCAMFEYFERRAHGQDLSPSRLFLHKNAVRMGQVAPGAGVGLRITLKAAAYCGLPPERYLPYDSAHFECEPEPFLYSFAQRSRDLCYLRLDERNTRGGSALDHLRAFLAAGFPAVLGFTVPTSISQAAEIPYRPTFDSTCGAQSVVAVGYDDAWLSATRGALLIRNSWGTNWGEDGYGWLPYAYVEERLAADIWTVLRPEWLASGEFARPAVIA